MTEQVVEQIDAVLVEDGRTVVLYAYLAGESEDVLVTNVELPVAITEGNFVRAEWERLTA